MSTQVSAGANRQQAIDAAIREISHIATLPEITLKIIELVENPESTAQDLHKVISNDPALCSRILKVVNSAFYGLPGQIGSINRAIVLLGLNAVKNIAIAASLAKLFRGGALTPSFSARNLWDHSTCTAAAAKLIAETMKVAFVDEAFLGGLMHKLGIIVEIQCDRQKFIEVVGSIHLDADGYPDTDMIEIEERVFGANHHEFGKALCEKWKFPASFAYICGGHRDPMSVPAENRTLPTIIAVASRLAAETPMGFKFDLMDRSVPREMLEALKLTREQLDEIREKLPEQYEAASAVLG